MREREEKGTRIFVDETATVKLELGKHRLPNLRLPRTAAPGGSADKERPATGFMRFAEVFSAKDAAEMRTALDAAEFSHVDERDWR